MKHLEENYDIVVVGAGHAGCEAALAGARLGLSTIMFTVSAESIALMPCNPNVGGSSKGHLVRELDALGGEMGKNIDKTFIQSKMLNCSKGPAVHSQFFQRISQIIGCLQSIWTCIIAYIPINTTCLQISKHIATK